MIKKYQGTDKYLLSQFEKVKVLKGADVVELPSWDVVHFISFKSGQYSSNEVDQIRLAQKKKYLINSIFGNFELMKWCRANLIEGCTTFPFEELTDHLKPPLVLSGKIYQIKSNFENNMTGCTK